MWKDALESLVKKPVTQKYPFVRIDAPDQLRSQLHWNSEKCTGCGLCAKDCPADAIDVIVLDKKAKRFVFRYNIDRCTFCGQCVASCRQDSLDMASDEWELAALTRDDFVVYYGADADVESVLAGLSDPKPEEEAAGA
jgi:NAD(P)H-quinone oxidoreductase subunit I